MADRKATSVLVVRLIVAFIALAYGLMNTFGMFGGPGLSTYASRMDGRLPVAGELTGYVVALGQLLGGIAMLLGPMSKLVAWVFVIFLVGDILLTGSYASLGESEFPLALAGACLMVANYGPGPLHIEIKKGEKKG